MALRRSVTLAMNEVKEAPVAMAFLTSLKQAMMRSWEESRGCAVVSVDVMVEGL
jgi:hypothetical protein